MLRRSVKPNTQAVNRNVGVKFDRAEISFFEEWYPGRSFEYSLTSSSQPMNERLSLSSSSMKSRADSKRFLGVEN